MIYAADQRGVSNQVIERLEDTFARAPHWHLAPYEHPRIRGTVATCRVQEDS